MSTQVWENTMIQRAKAGDQEALALLYEQYSAAIYHYIYVRVGDRDIAEDIRSDVFVRMLEGVEGFEYRGRPVIAWLYRIAHDRVVDTLRRRQTRSWMPLEYCSSSYDGPEASVAHQIDLERLRRCMKDLLPEQQQVIKLRFLAGLSIPEVAVRLGRSESAVRGLQHRGLQSLARLIETPSA